MRASGLRPPAGIMVAAFGTNGGAREMGRSS
jgi:hypothetical protein